MSTNERAALLGAGTTPLGLPAGGRAQKRALDASAVDDAQYLSQDEATTVTKLLSTSLSQAYVLGAISFLNAGLWMALTNLGSAGQEEPHLVMLSNSIGFSLSFWLALMGGSIVNMVGLKRTVTICTMSYPLYPLSLLIRANYGTSWPLVVSSILCNASGGLMGAAEGSIVLGYSTLQNRAKFISIFLGSMNIAPVIGGILNLILNFDRSTKGRVSDSTYLTFMCLMALGTPVSFLLRHPKDVIGVNISQQAEPTTWKQQLHNLGNLLKSHKWFLLLPLFLACGYCPAYVGTFLTVYFTVRARSLESLVDALAYVFGAFTFSFVMNGSSRPSLKNTWMFLWVVFALAWMGVFVIQVHLEKTNPYLDWVDRGFILPFLAICALRFTLGAVEAFEYWVIGNAEEGISKVAQISGVLRASDQLAGAVGYGISSTNIHMVYQAGLNVGFWFVIGMPTSMALRKHFQPG